MATITKRGSGWFTQVRRKSYPDQHKTFRLKADAHVWNRKQEGVIDASPPSMLGVVSLKVTTLRTILDHYIAEVNR